MLRSYRVSRLLNATALSSALLVGLSVAAQAGGGALPNGGKYVAGSGTIASTGSSLTVNQSSNTGIINWNGFSVGAGNSVNFNNGAGATLNRVTGGNLSQIAGSLTATGSLYLINPQGIVVDRSGKVVTGGSFVASTRDVSDSAFSAGGTLTFSGASQGGVINRGTITATTGDAVLIGNGVNNGGTLSAAHGTAGMASGNDVLLQKVGDQHLYVKSGTGDVTNRGTVAAANAELRAAGGNVYALAGNSGSAVSATGTSTEGGHVWLTANGGSVQVSGTVSAHNADGSGGQIVATGNSVTVGSTARLDASGTRGGTILVGGDVHGGTDAAQDFVKDKVATAATTTVARGARLSADGTAGTGGHVVVWSDQHTSFEGGVSAQGAGASGGGFAEVSSHKLLGFSGTADLLSSGGGKTGTLLLDPENVTISGGSTSNGTLSGGTFTPTGDDSVLNVTDLQTALAGADVAVTTGATGAQAGDITVAAPVTWSAHTLTLDAAHSIVINATLAATGTAGLALSATGTVTQSAAITTPSLLLAGNAAFTLTNAGNAIGTLAAHAGTVNLTDNAALAVGTIGSQAGIATTGALTLTTTGSGSNLTISAPLSGGAVTLVSAGTLAESGSGAIAATALTGSSVGGATLNGANVFSTLNDFANSGSGGFTLSDGALLNVLGNVDAGTGNLSITTTGAGQKIAFYERLSAGGTVTLDAGGLVAENTATGTVQAATLTGNATGGVTLNGANQVATLAGFTNSGAGGFAFTDTQSLGVTGAIGAGTGNLALTTTGSSSNLSLSSGLVAGGTATLAATGTIIQNAATGTIQAATLAGRATGGASFNGLNQVATLSGFTNTGAGGFALTDTQDLSVTGNVFAGSGSLSLTGSGTGIDIGFSGLLAATGTITLTATGTLTENASTGVVQASTLAGGAAGGATLNGANKIVNFGSFTNSGAGGIALTDTQNLNVSGAVNAGSGGLALTTTGSGHNIGLYAALTAGGAVSLTATGLISEATTGATIQSASLTGSAAGGVTLGTNNTVATLGTFTNTGAGNFTFTDTGALNVTGNVNAGSGNLTLTTTGSGNNLGFAATLTAGGTATLTASGTILENAATGVLSAATLAGRSAGGATFNGANLVGALGNFLNTGAGGFALTDGQALTVSGSVTAGSANIALTTTGAGNAIAVNGVLAATTAVSLTASGQITENVSTGEVRTSTLSGSSSGGATLNGGNQVVTFGAFTNSGAGGIAFTDTQNLNLGAIGAGTADLTLTTVSANHKIALDAALTAGGTVTLAATGVVSEVTTAATITANQLTGTSTGGALLAQQNAVGSLGAFTNTGAGGFVYTSSGGIAVSGAINAGTGSLTLTATTAPSSNIVISAPLVAGLTAGTRVTLTASGMIGETAGGTIQSDTLVSQSVGGTTLNGANLIADLQTVANGGSGSLALTDGQSVTVGAFNTLTQNASLTTTGAGHGMTLTGAVGAPGTVTLISAGQIVESGSGQIQAPTVTGSSVGGANLAGANTTTTLAGWTNTGSGGFAFRGGDVTFQPTLIVSGPVQAGTGDLTLTSTSDGDISIRAALDAGGTVDLISSGAVKEDLVLGSITATTVMGSTAGGHAGAGKGDFNLGGNNDIANVGNISDSVVSGTGGDDTITINDTPGGSGNPLTVIGTIFSQGTINLTNTGGNVAFASTGIVAGGVDLMGKLILGGTLTLNTSEEAVEDPAGQIDMQILNVTANTGINLIGDNVITTVGTRHTSSGPNVINQ